MAVRSAGVGGEGRHIGVEAPEAPRVVALDLEAIHLEQRDGVSDLLPAPPALGALVQQEVDDVLLSHGPVVPPRLLLGVGHQSLDQLGLLRVLLVPEQEAQGQQHVVGRAAGAQVRRWSPGEDGALRRVLLTASVQALGGAEGEATGGAEAGEVGGQEAAEAERPGLLGGSHHHWLLGENKVPGLEAAGGHQGPPYPRAGGGREGEAGGS